MDSTYDFSFACNGVSSEEGAWAALRVARVAGEEQMSRLFRYELTLLAPTGLSLPDVDTLVGSAATLRIRTLSDPPLKVVHGVVGEAALLDVLPEGVVYRVALEPSLGRARFGRRYRLFVGKSLRQIVDSVLQENGLSSHSGSLLPEPGGPSFSPAEPLYAWRAEEVGRIDDVEARPQCVQYGESDFDFVARLLEEEGIAFHFEHGDGVELFVLSDSDAGRPREALAVGPGIAGRQLDELRLGGRLRSSRIVVDDYDWRKPELEIAASAQVHRAPDLVSYEYPAGYSGDVAMGRPLAERRLDRLEVEARYASGRGSLRALSAGSIVTVEHPRVRAAGEYLVTELRVRGRQEGVISTNTAAFFGPDETRPFDAWLSFARRGASGAPDESRFRPARSTPRPRIDGTQTAFVTAAAGDNNSEIHVGGPAGCEIGCVRVRFHWDSDDARVAREPASAWVRVNQPFAGVGEGGVWHPRVGVEVIVAFDEGNPDRPVVVGRVYNGRNRPPVTSPTTSTLKSTASPGGGTYNEITFQDGAGSELIHAHAGNALDVFVANDSNLTVGADAMRSIGASSCRNVGAHETTTVGANETRTVGAARTESIGANRTEMIGGNRTETVGSAKSAMIGASSQTTMGVDCIEAAGGPMSLITGSNLTKVTGASQMTLSAGPATTIVLGPELRTVGGSETTIVAGPSMELAGGSRGRLVGGNWSTTCSLWTRTVGGMEFGQLNGGVTYETPIYMVDTPLHIDLLALSISLRGLSTSMTRLSMSVTGASLSLTKTSTSRTGVSLSLTVAEVDFTGAKLKEAPAKTSLTGMRVIIGAAPHMMA